MTINWLEKLIPILFYSFYSLLILSLCIFSYICCGARGTQRKESQLFQMSFILSNKHFYIFILINHSNYRNSKLRCNLLCRYLAWHSSWVIFLTILIICDVIHKYFFPKLKHSMNFPIVLPYLNRFFHIRKW